MLKHSARTRSTREHPQDMLQLYYEALGGYCREYQLEHPRGGPIWPPGQGIGRASNSKDDTFGLLAVQDFQSDKD